MIAEIITLRAIALKPFDLGPADMSNQAEIITLRAIALKQNYCMIMRTAKFGRDHNATSYSTETEHHAHRASESESRDHNATSYSTETLDDRSIAWSALTSQRS